MGDLKSKAISSADNPPPRVQTGCPSIDFTATLPAVITSSNTYDFGGAAINADATLTYSISGANLDTTPLTSSLANTRGSAFFY